MSDPVRKWKKRQAGYSVNQRRFKDTPTAIGDDRPRRLRDDSEPDFAAQIKVLIMNFVMSRPEGEILHMVWRDKMYVPS
jgi:hypothetical protein